MSLSGIMVEVVGEGGLLRTKVLVPLRSNGANHTAFLGATSLAPQKEHLFQGALFVVGGGGFEPPKSETSDLQSDAFGHSAIRPKY